MQLIEKRACFGGWQYVYKHYARTLGCEMNIGIYLPPLVEKQKLPVLYWLSGLTCTEQNFITKAGAQRYAAEHNVILVAPDTSPRGEGVADADSYDLGQGAGFYLNATQEPWRANYKMYDYILHELPLLIEGHFPATAQKSVFGHSMGGLGALVLALRNPEVYRSVSAFAPILSPSRAEWGQKAFSAYLGADQHSWRDYDPTELVLAGGKVENILIDQGLDDEFYRQQLCTENFAQACKRMALNPKIRYHENYDHSYYFVASFIGEHIGFHADKLYAGK
ncbi:S-formylglutathione hydrolase [Mesocricetibacter intestinalis]|uniref:S-formylglutathione hydrolase n=1 Tax=Mesocricetibacter intestinalis TaxID=1521930 RepID=A0A4R6VF66_9PAST|nr:S-formylglutathione hydrolase [Mesocricetibacter intestinalis]TDQ59625.1 S-formylglutathione hydrolase [Mesocricetibacter intestinalis]